MRELSPAQVGTVPCFHKEVSVMLKTRKVVIVGAGHVGSHVALARKFDSCKSKKTLKAA